NADLTVNASNDGDRINLLATTGTTNSYILNGGTGSDTFNIGGPTLEDIQRPVTIHGNGPAPSPTIPAMCPNMELAPADLGDVLNFNDQGSAGNNTYNLSATTFQRTAAVATAQVVYDTVETIRLNAGTGNDQINVASTAASAQTIVNADG